MRMHPTKILICFHLHLCKTKAKQKMEKIAQDKSNQVEQKKIHLVCYNFMNIMENSLPENVHSRMEREPSSATVPFQNANEKQRHTVFSPFECIFFFLQKNGDEIEF